MKKGVGDSLECLVYGHYWSASIGAVVSAQGPRFEAGVTLRSLVRIRHRGARALVR